jgi:hypothetical protein
LKYPTTAFECFPKLIIVAAGSFWAIWIKIERERGDLAYRAILVPGITSDEAISSTVVGFRPPNNRFFRFDNRAINERSCVDINTPQVREVISVIKKTV